MKHTIDQGLANVLRETRGADNRVTVLFEYMRARGISRYDESVTQLEHGLQAAHLAREAGAPPSEITAALLHDIGHLLVGEFDGTDDFLHNDLEHEAVGARYMEPFFPPEITEPIRLHVPAKRYLCTTDPSYLDQLSVASKRSFELQGGRLSDEEKADLEKNPHLDIALRLRRRDDAAKVANLSVPDIDSYRESVRLVMLEAQG